MCIRSITDHADSEPKYPARVLIQFGGSTHIGVSIHTRKWNSVNSFQIQQIRTSQFVIQIVCYWEGSAPGRSMLSNYIIGGRRLIRIRVSL